MSFGLADVSSLSNLLDVKGLARRKGIVANVLSSESRESRGLAGPDSTQVITLFPTVRSEWSFLRTPIRVSGFREVRDVVGHRVE